jgi:hypothetical protein
MRASDQRQVSVLQDGMLYGAHPSDQPMFTQEAIHKKHQRRCESIALVQRSPSYCLLALVLGDMPHSPDPWGSSITRRQWKVRYNSWRSEILELIDTRLTLEDRALVDIEDWTRRHYHRFDGLGCVKRKPLYCQLCEISVELPLEPDPWDRSISKRQWENKMQGWRKELEDLMAARAHCLD